MNKNWDKDVLNGIKHSYTVMAKNHVHPWYTWAVLAVALGFTAGVAYVANQNMKFDESEAARYFAASSNEEGGLDYGSLEAEEDAEIDVPVIASAGDLPAKSTELIVPSPGLPAMPTYASCGEQNVWWRTNSSKLKGFAKRKGANFPCPSDESDIASAMLLFNSLTQNSKGFASYVPEGKLLGDFIMEKVGAVVRNGSKCSGSIAAYSEGKNIHFCVKGWFKHMTGSDFGKDVYVLQTIVHEFGHFYSKSKHVSCKYGGRKGQGTCDAVLADTPFTKTSSAVSNEYWLYAMISEYYKMPDDFAAGVNGLIGYYKEDAFNSPKPKRSLKLAP